VRPVNHRWWAVCAGITGVALVASLAVILAGPSGRSGDAAAAPGSPAFGVLGSSCEPGRVAALRRAGVTTVVTEVQWAAAEPAPGAVDRGYLAGVRQGLTACSSAGLRVVLGLGLQNPPPWVLGLPAATFVDQSGAASTSGEANLVFSAGARKAATAYLRDVAGLTGFEDVGAVRLAGELGYPGPEAGASGPSFWAFDAAAQGGPGLAAGVSPSPMPAWLPGVPVYRLAPVGGEEVARWYDWYTSSLAGSVVWLAETLRSVGFAGEFHVPLAGRGVLPVDHEQSVATLLDGRADPDGALGRGLDYPRQFSVFAELDARLRAQSPPSRVVVDYTGLDDDTATRTRAETPGEETCRSGDSPGSLAAAGLDRGASQRWTITLARAARLGVVAENPGPPERAQTGGSPFSDGEADQMVQGARYARDCGLEAFYLAFEDDLFTPGSGVDVPAYGRVIAGTGAGR